MTSVIGFSARLAYIRWLRDMGKTESENTREFVEAIGVEYAWFQKWKDSERPPTRRPEIKALVSGIASMGVTEDWLIDGSGAPPRPELWKHWLEERSKPQARAGKRGAPATRPGTAKKTREA